MIVAGTGHRPDKLGGYGVEVSSKLQALARNWLEQYRPTTVISGMALGWDTALALAALDVGIPLTAAVPFAGQECKWPSSSQRRYGDILRAATTVHVVTSGGYAAWKMQRRNLWMVDQCSTVLALWNGTPGGTANCVSYALVKPRPVINLWDLWKEVA